jgi:ATP/maltotriose-dependent transcriptional regulator MalT
MKRLTRREQEVLTLLMQGISNKEIGLRLFLSTETIKKHVYNTYQKLGVHDRASAMERAKELKLLG